MLFKNKMEQEAQNENGTEALNKAHVSTSLREQSLEWFFGKSEIEKSDLKEKHFTNTPIQHSSQWGFHFTFGQIDEMYKTEHK